ncbi:MAG: hypothetical protein HY901_10445 [Deltaproteobacteria bacterium]|nr:hypothetical protein [Deltaproteobacteria bacterium]
MRNAPKVLGILSICLGSLASLTSLVGLFGHGLTRSGLSLFGEFLDRMPRQHGQPRPGQMMERTVEAMDAVRPYQMAISGTLLALSLAVIVIGVGLLRRQAWARRAAIVWGVLAIAFIPVMTWIQAGVIQPRTQQAVSSVMPDGPAEGFMRTMGQLQVAFTAVGTLTFWLPFPVVMLALLGRKSARKDFSAQPEAAPALSSGGPGPNPDTRL